MRRLIYWFNILTKKRKELKRWQRIVTVLAAVMTFATTYALILPAITVEKENTEEVAGMYLEETAEGDDLLEEDALEPEGVSITGDMDDAVTGEDEGVETDADIPEYDEEIETALSVETLKASGSDYIVTLSYDESSGIPEGAALDVSEIAQDSEEYQTYLEEAKKAMGLKEEETLPSFAARFFDIKIMVGEQEFTPESGVSVEITYTEPLAEHPDTEVSAVHFADDTAEAEVIEANTTEVQEDGQATVEFTAESFSVYGVIYTVDFHWEVDGQTYDFSVPGGEFVSFYNLVKILGIEADDPDTENDEVQDLVNVVESITFSNPELLSISKVEEDTTVGAIKESLGLECEYSAELTEEEITGINDKVVKAGDWALISLKPFDTEESLTVTMKNGDVWTVKVTDEAVSEVQSGRSYVLYTVSNVNGRDIYRVLDIYGYSHDYTDPAELEALGDEYLWTVSYSNNWIIRSKSTVRGGDGRDYYTYLDVNGGHNQQVNDVVRWVRAYSTDYPYAYLQNNGNSTFNIYGINYNNLALCWNNGFLIHNSQYASAMRFYQQHPTYDYTVVTANASEGLVSGYSTQNGRQENNTDYIWSTTNTSKTNNTLITANPTSSRYLFSHWELDGDMVYANGTTTDDGSGATMGSRIEPGQLRFTANNQELKARFILNPDVTSNVPAKSFDEEALQAWYDLLQNTNPPFSSVDKTAEVYDYYNRIYQIDFTAASGVQTFASDIDLSFVMDVSNSMLFPATMNPYKVGGNVVTKKLTSNSLDSLPHSNGEKYFVIGDEGYTSTVYTIWHNGSSWQFADASQYAINRYAERNGGSVHEKEYQLTSSNLSTYTSNPPRLNTSDDFVIYTTSGDYFTGFNDIYSKNNPAYNRLYYMKNAMETIVADAKDLAEEAARLGDASDNSNVRVAWEVFNRLHSNGSDFRSVTDTTYGDTNYNTIVNALDNTQTSGGTRQDRGLDWAKNNFSYASSATSTKRIAILITDGAPMITGDDQHHNDYNSSHEQAMGDYYAPTTGDGAWLRDEIRSKANELKAGADGELGTDDDVTLITIGLGVDRVANAPEWLEEVASELPSEQQVDGGSKKYFYNVTDTAKLKYVLYDILQTFSAGANIDTTVTDVIDDAFYPVDKLGEPLGVGDTYTDDNGVTGTIGQKEVTLGDGTKKTLWTVTWDHESVKWADHGGWHGSVLVKTKEDFLGGNTINTNQESSVTANSFTADNSYDNFEPKVVPIENNKTVNPPTPYVNINELKMESDSTSWKVYLGENVDPAEEIVRLCEQVRVVEMVTQTRDDDQDGEPDHRYNSGIMLGHQTEGEAEKFLLKDIIGKLSPEDIAELLDGYTLIKEYDKDVAQAYGHDVGTIYIELSQCEVAAGETGLETSPHQTTLTNADNGGEPVELYELTVWYMADDPANIEYHTGNYIGEGAGRVTNDVTVECSHEINVFAKSLQLFKRNEDYSRKLTDAKFAIYRTWRVTDGNDKKVPLSGKEGDYFIEYPEVTVDANGIATFEKLPLLGENEVRYLKETEPPEGYMLLEEPLEITLNFDSVYRPVPPKEDNGWTENAVTDKAYDWEEKASLSLSTAQKANSDGEKDT